MAGTLLLRFRAKSVGQTRFLVLHDRPRTAEPFLVSPLPQGAFQDAPMERGRAEGFQLRRVRRALH